MTIVSLAFLIFIFTLIIIYYVLPKKFQWIVLLSASIIFYLFSGLKGILYLLITSVSIYFSSVNIQKSFDRQKSFLKENKETLTKEEKKLYKAKFQAKRKRVLILSLVLNFGILCAMKYTHFILDQINSFVSLFGLSGVNNTFSIILPLGISFYTFQATGYLLDVYWEKCRAERNYFKTLLFISFFPQITQGPISSFEQLSGQLFAEHKFQYRNYSRGIQRMIWGFAKKTLIANAFSPYVDNVFTNYSQYSGVTVFIGALMYSVQIYADFSGYMDIMCGICEVLDIQLTENFNRPYFSKSVAEYWRRWHISLGTWFKNYVYYPIGVSKWNRKIAKSTKEKFGKRLGDTVPASVALVIVWLTTGLWHGASWAYIIWGLVNGLFIILSMWLEPVYDKSKRLLRINESNRLWVAFQTLRTFLLVTFIKVLPEVGTLSQGLNFIKSIFTNYHFPKGIKDLFAFLDFSVTTNLIVVAIAVFTTGVLFVFSLIQRKKPVRDYFNKLPMLLRTLILSFAVIVIIGFGVRASWGTGGFLYAGF